MRNTLRVRRAEHGERGISQHALALALGIHRDRIHRIEVGYAEPTPEEMQTLADYFGCSIAKLFPGAGRGRKAAGAVA